MKRLICILLCLLLAFPLFSCADQKSEKTFFLMDTLITVTLYASKSEAEPIFEGCRERLQEMERLWSRTFAESEVSQLNTAKAGQKITLDARTVRLLSLAAEVSFHTKGAFDVTVALLVTMWQTCEENNVLPTQELLSDVLDAVGWENVTIDEGKVSKTRDEVQIDLGGIGKGAAISYLIQYLEQSGVRGGLISFGSNVAVFGEKPNGESFQIALRNPVEESAYAGVLQMQPGQVLSVSGDYERYYTVGGEKYHHILDPETGYPSQSGLTSVAVICHDGALADALSTALFVMGEALAMELYESGTYDFEAIFITSSGNVHATKGLEGYFRDA